MESMKTRICNSLFDLDQKCDRYQLYDKDDEFLNRFKTIYFKLYNWDNNDDNYANMMQEYAQAVLDFTFYEENKLVEKDFAVPNAKEKLQSIIDRLSEIEKLCHEYSDEPISLLGQDIVECLLWRKGALLYMFCATIEEKPQLLNTNKEHFLKSLRLGICYLEKMLKVKKPLIVPKRAVDFKDDDTYFLLSSGIYSDKSVLALIYAGEMCYWHKKHWSSDCELPAQDFNASELGFTFLEKYIKTTEGPLKGRGWNVSKARELLTKL